jgi:hypothetical protein
VRWGAMLQALHAFDSDQHVAFTSFWRMGTMEARVPPLREPFEAQGKPTRSLGSEREEKASAHFGRDDSWVAANEKTPARCPSRLRVNRRYQERRSAPTRVRWRMSGSSGLKITGK